MSYLGFVCKLSTAPVRMPAISAYEGEEKMPTLEEHLNAMQPVFDAGRVEEAASVIADELKTLLDRFNFESPIYKRLAKSAAYSNGLTNGEDVVARLMAVNTIQSELTKKLTSLKESYEEDEAA